MKTRFFALTGLIGFASACFLLAQSPTPAESPAKQRARKKAQTAVAPAESPPPGHQPKKGVTTATSPQYPTATPSATLPEGVPGRQPKVPTATPSGALSTTSSTARRSKGQEGPRSPKEPRGPIVTPTPKFNFADLFKPRTSGGTTSAAAAPAPARGASAAAATKSPAPGGGHGLVWVNTETHVYHREGSRFYGTTKKGKYMKEPDAVKEGDKPAKGHE